MVSVSISVLINHIRQSFSQATSLSFITAIILQTPRKLLRDHSSSGKGPRRHHRALYPRTLQRRNSNNDPLFDTMAVAEYFSSSPSSVSHANATATAASNVPATTTAKRKNIDVSGLDMPVTPQYRPPRAPIVLCHGLYGFDKWGPEAFPALQVHYWGGIEDALAKLGAKVIVTRVPRTGSVWERARELHAISKSILAGKDVNFVAHSMGGLDCRHLLSHIHDRPYRVQSLTTVSTPHRGSPVMDWFRDHVGVGMADAIHDAAKQAHDKAQAAAAATGSPPPSTPLRDLAKLPIHLLDPIVQKIIRLLDTPAYANLTTDYCKNYFNPNTRDDPNVAYYSYGASVEIPLWSVLGLPWQVVKEKEGDNDGIVSVESAKWGKYVKTVEANHWELNGQNKSHSLTSKIPPRWRANLPALELYTSADKTKFDSVEFYLEVANFLYEQGH